MTRASSGLWTRWCALAAALLIPCFISACGVPLPIQEGEIPVSHTIDFEYDESRLRVSSLDSLTVEQERIVLELSQATTARYIEARSPQREIVVDGRFRGQLSLHRGWRQEFFPLVTRDYHEIRKSLPPGSLYWDLTPNVVGRDFGIGWAVRGIRDWFSGFLTTVVEVENDGLYTFQVDSDDGTIGVLQNLLDDSEEFRVLWYDWSPQPMGEELLEVKDVPLRAGTYLLTVHYFEATGQAAYRLGFSRQFTEDSLRKELTEPPNGDSSSR